MQISREQEADLLTKLKAVVRQSSLNRLRLYSQSQDFKFTESPHQGKSVLAHWMSIVLVSGSSVRITFKAHFMSDQIKKLASKLYKRPVEDLGPEQYSDYVKEYCNLTAGSIKKVFERNKMHVGISLPLVTRGFDEIFFPVEESNSVACDMWRIENHEISLDCTSIIEIFDPEGLLPLNLTVAPSEGEEEIEFL